MSAVWSSVIAVAGTLLGGVTTGAVQLRGARAERRENRREDRRNEVVAAVTVLLAALATHRSKMFALEEWRLSGAPSAVVDAARAASRESRSAVTAPLVTVRLLAPALGETARQAASAAYAMRNAPDMDTLETLRANALAASDLLLDKASEIFSGMAVAS